MVPKWEGKGEEERNMPTPALESTQNPREGHLGGMQITT